LALNLINCALSYNAGKSRLFLLQSCKIVLTATITSEKRMKKMLHTVLALSVSLAVGQVNATEEEEQKWHVESP
jgi:hypothetical protein